MNILRPLNIVRTNYESGPYVITEVTGPCTCPEYLRHLDGDDTPSEPHFHLTCRMHGQPERGDYWLNGYREDGTNVWSDDRIEVVGEAAGQLELFS